RADVLERPEDALAELGPGVRVREHLARRDQVRLDQRSPRRRKPELDQALAHDGADLLRVVVLAMPDDDPRLARRSHVQNVAPTGRGAKAGSGSAGRQECASPPRWSAAPTRRAGCRAG